MHWQKKPSGIDKKFLSQSWHYLTNEKGWASYCLNSTVHLKFKCKIKQSKAMTVGMCMIICLFSKVQVKLKFKKQWIGYFFSKKSLWFCQ